MFFSLKFTHYAMFFIFGLIVVLIIFYILIPFLKLNRCNQKLESFLKENNISFTKIKNKNYNYELNINEKKYLLKIVDIPVNCDLQINCYDTWQIFKKGSMKTEFIRNLTGFMDINSPNKLILLVNKPKHMKLVLNECEMKMINFEENVYNTHILTENDLNYLLRI